MPSSTPGSRLKAARENLGLTQAGVAQLISQSKETYKGWEQDRSRPRSFTIITKLCSILHITSDHYISGKLNTILTPTEADLLEKISQLTSPGQAALSAILLEMRKK